MSCKECEHAPKTYEEFCISRRNYSGYYCPDSYTEKSHLCGNYGIKEVANETEKSTEDIRQ